MGIILLRGSSLEEVKQILNEEPFRALGLGTYEGIEWDVDQGLGFGGLFSESLALLEQGEKATDAS